MTLVTRQYLMIKQNQGLLIDGWRPFGLFPSPIFWLFRVLLLQVRRYAHRAAEEFLRHNEWYLRLKVGGLCGMKKKQ